jgi:hypothetical protein
MIHPNFLGKETLVGSLERWILTFYDLREAK